MIQYSRALVISGTVTEYWIAQSSRATTSIGDDFGPTASILPLRLQSRHGNALARQLIGAFVGVVAGMALDPVPAHLVLV